MDPHRLGELRSLAYHRVIAERLAEQPELLERARTRVESWLGLPAEHEYWAREWLAVLSLPLARLQHELAQDSERMRALRQSSPFAGALRPRERWTIWRQVREQNG